MQTLSTEWITPTTGNLIKTKKAENENSPLFFFVRLLVLVI